MENHEKLYSGEWEGGGRRWMRIDACRYCDINEIQNIHLKSSKHSLAMMTNDIDITIVIRGCMLLVKTQDFHQLPTFQKPSKYFPTKL